MTIPGIDFLKVFYFFSGWSCHFKRLFLPVWREIHLSKILPVTLWQFTNRTVSVFHVVPDISYVNLFFPREFLIWFKSIQAKQVDHETSSLARSLRGLMHWSSLRSLKNLWEVDLWQVYPRDNQIAINRFILRERCWSWMVFIFFFTHFHKVYLLGKKIAVLPHHSKWD